MAATISPYCLDHVIMMLDTPDFEDPPEWLSKNFNIIEGGTHAGGSSRNKLIIFADGTYIELINWIGQPKEFFDWAPKAPGLIDFSLTTPHSAQETYQAVTARLQQQEQDQQPGDGGLGIRYKDPLSGGRKRKDGQQVSWFVTKPQCDNSAPNVPKPTERFFPTGRIDTPFFCHDVTDRQLRVPSADKTITTHPCGARGMLSVEVLVPEAQIDSYVRLYGSVTGATPKVHGGYRYSPTTSVSFVHGGYRYSPTTSVSFLLSSPEADEPAMKSLLGRVGIEIRAPRDGDDESWLKERGVGIREIRLFVPARGEDEIDESPLDSEGMGSSLLLVAEPLGCWGDTS